VTFTATSNLHSRAVMERLAFERQPHRDFDHPTLDVGHPLRPHVVYAMMASGRRTGAAGR
jgi:RimJ/RimL family protein N-acetyltransferase